MTLDTGTVAVVGAVEQDKLATNVAAGMELQLFNATLQAGARKDAKGTRFYVRKEDIATDKGVTVDELVKSITSMVPGDVPDISDQLNSILAAVGLETCTIKLKTVLLDINVPPPPPPKPKLEDAPVTPDPTTTVKYAFLLEVEGGNTAKLSGLALKSLYFAVWNTVDEGIEKALPPLPANDTPK